MSFFKVVLNFNLLLVIQGGRGEGEEEVVRGERGEAECGDGGEYGEGGRWEEKEEGHG